MEKRNLLTALDPNAKIETEDEMMSLLKEMNETDRWLHPNTKSLKISYVEEGSTPEYIYPDATEAQVDEAYGRGTFVCEINGTPYLMNDTAILTVGQCTEVCCRLLSKLVDRDNALYYNRAEAANLYNIGMKHLQKETCILVRGGQVMAMFSDKYKIQVQEDAFTLAIEKIKDRFPNAKYVDGSYSHTETKLLYELCDTDDKIFDAYRAAWLASGYSENDLKEARMFIELASGDTGYTTFMAVPSIMTAMTHADWKPLLAPSKSKHIGKVNTTISEIVDKIIGDMFAKSEEGLNQLAYLMQLELKNPQKTFEKILKELKLDNACRAIKKNLEDSVKFLFSINGSATKVTAFALYTYIMEIMYYKEFSLLKPSVRIKVLDSLYRLPNLDWDKLNK